MIRERCRAKLNLFLDVVGRRDDGFHDIVTLFHEIDLADGLEVREGKDAGAVRIDVSGDAGADVSDVPADETNLAVRAAKALLLDGGATSGIALRLTKRIPTGGGLGGGSADAAGTLRAVDRLLELGASDDDLERVALTVGSDAPFFVRGGTAIGRGRGERLERVLVAPAIDFAILVPDFGISTASVYAACVPTKAARGDVGPALRALEDGDAAALAATCSNALLEPALTVEPRLREVLVAARAKLGPGVHMTGSGSTLFLPLARGAAMPDVAGIPHLRTAFVVRAPR